MGRWRWRTNEANAARATRHIKRLRQLVRDARKLLAKAAAAPLVAARSRGGA